MTKHFSYTLFVFFLIFTLHAQDGSYSPYSYFKFGDQVEEQTVENISMGHLNFYNDSIHYNILLPSTLANLRLVNYSIASAFNLYQLKSAGKFSSAGTFVIPYVTLGIPFGNKGGIGFGFKPFSTSGFLIMQEDASGKSAKTGEGGMNMVFVAGGYRLFKGFNVGFAYHYYFGNKIARFVHYKPDVYAITRQIDNSYFSGHGFSFSADYTREFSSGLYFQAGAYYRLTAPITSENSSVLQISDNSFGRERIVNSITLREDTTQVVLPSAFSLGMGAGKKKQWFVGAEYQQDNWQVYQNDFFTSPGITYRNAQVFKLGGYWQPDFRSHVSYFKRITYKSGFYYKKGDLLLDNQPINEFGISFGFSLPLSYYFSNVNVGFEYVKRGAKTMRAVDEHIFKLKIGFSFNDKWFVKRKIY